MVILWLPLHIRVSCMCEEPLCVTPNRPSLMNHILVKFLCISHYVRKTKYPESAIWATVSRSRAAAMLNFNVSLELLLKRKHFVWTQNESCCHYVCTTGRQHFPLGDQKKWLKLKHRLKSVSYLFLIADDAENLHLNWRLSSCIINLLSLQAADPCCCREVCKVVCLNRERESSFKAAFGACAREWWGADKRNLKRNTLSRNTVRLSP